MPSQKNIDQVKNLQEKLQQAKSIVLADYRGLTVNNQQKLRRAIVASGGELLVAKNTLLQIALKKTLPSLPRDFEAILQGPTMVLFAYEDEIAPIKALAEFAKEHDLPQIKAGLINKEALSADQINQLASLPTKVELVSQTIAAIKAPLSGIVNVLSANLKNLVYVLKEVNLHAR